MNSSAHPNEDPLANEDPLVAQIRAASKRLSGIAFRTPLLPFRDGSYVKAENLQLTGSFKFRGAYNALAQLDDEQRARGVVAHSSGNHAQAVARAARMLGMRAVVVMPRNAPRVKVAGVEADGAEIVFVGPHNEERVARAHEIADAERLELVSSANDERVMAGQGTAGLEILEQLAELGPDLDSSPVVIVPVGLGGLAAGVSTAIKSLRPAAHVVAAEPELAADTRDSLMRGERVAWSAEDTGRTIADGLRAESPAPIPFEAERRNLDRVVTVSEEEIVRAMAVAARELKLVLEPSGAVSLAALIFHAAELPSGEPRVALLSGGNVDPERYVEYLAQGARGTQGADGQRARRAHRG